jgi:hypothetical protein
MDDKASQVLVKIVEAGLGRILMREKSHILPQIILVQVIAQGDVEVGQVDELQLSSPGTQAEGVEDRSSILPFFRQMKVIEGAEEVGSLFSVEVFARGGSKPGAIQPKPGSSFEDTGVKGGTYHSAGFLDPFEILGKSPIGQLPGSFQIQGEFSSLPCIGGLRGHRQPAGRKVAACRNHHFEPFQLEVFQG